MITLPELQEQLQRLIIGTSSKSEHLVKLAQSLTYPDRIHAYQHAYPARILGALEESYPCLCKILGDDRYQLAEEYGRAFPPTSFDLSEAGAQMGYLSFCGIVAVCRWRYFPVAACA